jgi:hypothetical protein
MIVPMMILSTGIINIALLILLSLSKLLNSFQSHRSKLSPSSRIVFDQAWNPLFDNINDTDNTIQLKSELLLNELTVVNQLANKQFQEYENAPTHVLGATLMKQFLTDLLGRDTLYAKVFQNIIEKEMEMEVVPVDTIPTESEMKDKKIAELEAKIMEMESMINDFK